MGLEHEYDRMLGEIRELRGSLIENKTEIELRFVLPIDEATWVSRRIYEEVDRGILSAKFNVKHSEYSIELGVVLALAVGTAVVAITKRTVNLLFDELEDYLDRRKKRRRKRKAKNAR